MEMCGTEMARSRQRSLRLGRDGFCRDSGHSVAARQLVPSAYTVEKPEVEMMFCSPASFNVGLCLGV